MLVSTLRTKQKQIFIWPWSMRIYEPKWKREPVRIFFLFTISCALPLIDLLFTERRRQSQQNMTAQPPKVMATNGSAALHQAPRPSVVSVTTNMSSTSISSKKNNKKDKNKKITKADIGLPSDFKHVSHVGWDPNQGFALENVDPHLLQFFAKA